MRERYAHNEASKRLGRAVVDVDATNTALGARRLLVEPDRRRIVGDGERERRLRGAVVRGARARVEAVQRRVVVVQRDTRRVELGLDELVGAVRDCEDAPSAWSDDRKLIWDARKGLPDNAAVRRRITA